MRKIPDMQLNSYSYIKQYPLMWILSVDVAYANI